MSAPGRLAKAPPMSPLKPLSQARNFAPRAALGPAP